MAEGNSDGTVWAAHRTLEAYHGSLTDELRALLSGFGHDTHIPVHTYTYKDKGKVVKYRVLIILPEAMTPYQTRPQGEGWSELAAYHEALMEALVTIREYKAHLLEGTSFIALPHHTDPKDVVPDHTHIVTKKPESAIKLLNKYAR